MSEQGFDVASYVIGMKASGEPEQSKTEALSMIGGNQTIVPDAGYVLNSVTITKPSTLIASNVAVGIDIGGVIGTHLGEKPEQSKTVALSMETGSQSITPDNTYVLTGVTVTKPSTLIPGNIAKDINIGGVIGTLSANTGVTQVAPSDVSFYDCDGSCIYAYTKAEALALTELPSLVNRTGDAIPLIAQGWNYTLSSMQNYITSYNKLNIGAGYISSDGKTHLEIKIATTGRMTVPLYFSQTIANGISIEWGDGSTVETLAGTGNVNTSHVYTAVGDYDIALTVAEGCSMGLGSGSSSFCVMGSINDIGKVYCGMLQRVVIGERVPVITNYAFNNCYSLLNVIIPNTVTKIGNYAFQSCYSLTEVIVPNSVTEIGASAFANCFSLINLSLSPAIVTIGTSAFQSCYSLDRIMIPTSLISLDNYIFSYCYALSFLVIPENVTTIGNSAFQSCYNLANISIPSTTSSIGTYVFRLCYGVGEYHIKSITPPTLADANSFDNIAADCTIYVPTASLNTYTQATNWATLSSYMVGE